MKFKYSKNYYDVFGIYENDGVKEIVHIRVWGNGFKSDLEKIILESEGSDSETLIGNYVRSYGNHPATDYSKGNTTKEITEHVLSTNEDRLTMVDSLGPGILGLYSPAEDWAYVVKGLSPAMESYVKQHEFGHRLAVYLGIPPTEHMADAYATAITGYNHIPGRLNYN